MDGRPNSRNKASLSNFLGVVWTDDRYSGPGCKLVPRVRSPFAQGRVVRKPVSVNPGLNVN